MKRLQKTESWLVKSFGVQSTFTSSKGFIQNNDISIEINNKIIENESELAETFNSNCIKGALSSLRQFLATDSPLKMMKNAFYFTLKALLVLKIFKLLSSIFGHVEKRVDWKDKVNFKVDDVTT